MADWSEAEDRGVDEIELERWLQAVVFGDRETSYFLGEASDSPFVAGDEKRFPETRVVRNTDSFGLVASADRAAPVAAATVLPATRSNTVEVVVPERDRHVVELRLPLAPGALDHPDLASEEGWELDLCCTAADSATLDAFLNLAEGRWPRSLALPEHSREAWPKLGTRAAWRTLHPASDPGPAEIANVLRHPLADRLLRLPVHGLSAAEDGTVSIRVELDEDAKRVGELLRGRLKLNHVLFWNRLIGLADRVDDLEPSRDSDRDAVFHLPESVDGSACLILECWEQASGVTYCDERWSPWVDPLRRFRLRAQRFGDRELVLDFAGPVERALKLVYLIAAPWEERGLDAGDFTVAWNGRPMFAAVTEPTHVHSRDWEAAMRRLGAAWLALGGRMLPSGLVHTEEGLRRRLIELMPRRLRSALASAQRRDRSGRPEDLEVETRMEASPTSDSGVLPHARPTIVVTFECRPDADLDAVSHHLEWLCRTVEPLCPVGTSLRLEARRSGERGA